MKNRDSSHYQRIWRWHFYAGLFVAPFLILLSLTGILYLYKPQLDNLLYPELMKVAPATQTLSADQLLAKATIAMPDASLRKYLPPAATDASAQLVVNQGDRELTLFMDPASGALLGTMDNKWNLQAVARALHAELLLGTTGDRLIELAAGWGIVLLVSGLYLWWPRKGPGVGGILWPRMHQRGRLWWRDLHAVVGFWGAGFLLLLLLSGMTWTGFWGDQFAAVWNRFPASMWNQVPESAPLARQLNQPHQQTVPWALENTPLPESGAHHTHTTSPTLSHQGQIALQQIVELAESRGVAPGYSISLPQGERGVYTVSLFADDPRHDATLHMDQYSGAVLADVRWRITDPLRQVVSTVLYPVQWLMVQPLENIVADADIKGIKDEFFVIVPDDEHEGCFLPYLYVQLKDGYTLDDVRDKINACLPERYMRPVEIFTVPERPFFHFKTNRIGLSKEIIAKRNQQKEKAKRNSFADGCIA